MGSEVITNIQITIDTDKVMRDHPNPSLNPDYPTGLSHIYQHMVVSGNEVLSGQGGADVNFRACVGDVIRFHGTSEYNNFDNPLLIYNIQRIGGTNVFSAFKSGTYTKYTLQPDFPNVRPPVFNKMKFWFFEADVVRRGIENYQISFLLYKGQRGSPRPVLHGYFYWDTTITVKY